MKDLLAWALPLLHKRTNFVLASFGTAALATFFVADRFGINWYSCAVFPACLIIILFATYALLTQYPTTKKNHIGLVFAITGESQNSVEIIEADFIKPVRTELSRNALQTPFHSLTLSQTHAAKVHDVETALTALAKCKAHFIVYGDLRERPDNGKKYQVLRLQAAVVHAPISNSEKSRFVNEMTKSLPLNQRIDNDNILSQFELAAAQFVNGAKFIVAKAAMYSNDFQMAENLLRELLASINLIKKQGKATKTNDLVELVPKTLSDCYFMLYRMSADKWVEDRGLDSLTRAEDYLEKMNGVSSNDPRYHLAKAICEFVIRRNTSAALQSIEKASKFFPNDARWRYSKAFLMAYDGNLTGAWKIYQKIPSLLDLSVLPLEIEGFIVWILAVEPNKFQLHYCLGLINLWVKEDPAAALSDFRTFTNHSDIGKFPDAAKWAKETMIKIENPNQSAI